MNLPKNGSKRGIGLYTEEQNKYVTPFQFFAQIVVGGIIAAIGVMLGIGYYQSGARSAGWLLLSVVTFIIGVFWTHAGAIFWFRRLRAGSKGNPHI